MLCIVNSASWAVLAARPPKLLRVALYPCHSTRTHPRRHCCQALTYVMALGRTLYSTALRLESKGREGAPAAERTVSIEAGAREAIAQLEHGGRMVLACRWGKVAQKRGREVWLDVCVSWRAVWNNSVCIVVGSGAGQGQHGEHRRAGQARVCTWLQLLSSLRRTKAS